MATTTPEAPTGGVDQLRRAIDVDLGTSPPTLGGSQLGEPLAPEVPLPLFTIDGPAKGQEEPPVQFAGAGVKALKTILGFGDTPPKRLKDIAPEGPEPTDTQGDLFGAAGGPKQFTVIREASEEEISRFRNTPGATEGKPPTVEFNLDKIEGPEDIKATIDSVSKVWQTQGRAAGRGTMTQIEILALAEKMGLEDNVMLLLNRTEGQTFNAEEIAKSLQTIASSAASLDKVAKEALGSTDQAVLLKFRQHLAFHAALQTSMKGAQMEAGRALGAFKTPRNAGDEIKQQAVAQMLDSLGGENSTREMAKAYLALPVGGPRNQFAKNGWSRAKDAWFTVWINGLLSSPSTHMANIGGNMIFALLQIPERAIAGVIGGVKQFFGSEAERVYVGEAVAQGYALITSTKEAFILAAQSFKQNAPVRDLSAKIIAEGQSSGISEALHLSGPIGAGIDLLATAPGRMLMSEDEFFKAWGYRMELNTLSYRKAQEMARAGASPEDIARSTRELLANPPDDIRFAAEKMAQVQTFTDPVQGVFGQLGAAIQGTMFGRFMLPFFRTPYNITKAALERTAVPFGILAAVRAPAGPARDLAIARFSLGSGISAITASWYTEGKITGSGPGDTNLRRAMEDIGWKRWSFVMPKKGVDNPRWLQMGNSKILHPDDVEYVSYHRMEPISMVLAMTADITERLAYPRVGQQETEEIAMNGVGVVYEYLKDQSFLQGFANIAQLMSVDPAKGGWQASRAIQDLVGSQMPGSSLLATYERLQDPTLENILPDRNEPLGLRDVTAGLRRLSSRLPWTDKSGVPPLRDRFAEPRSAKNARVVDAIFPPFVADIVGDDPRTTGADPIKVRLVKLGMPVTMPGRSIDGVRLNDIEYDAFVMAASFPKGARSFYEALEGLMNHKNFAGLSVGQKQKEISDLDSLYKTIAREQILADPEYADLAAEIEEQKVIIEEFGRQNQ